jgi:hypothetical protein
LRQFAPFNDVNLSNDQIFSRNSRYPNDKKNRRDFRQQPLYADRLSGKPWGSPRATSSHIGARTAAGQVAPLDRAFPLGDLGLVLLRLFCRLASIWACDAMAFHPGG